MLLIGFILSCSGGKITKVSGECIKIIDSNGHSTTLKDETCERSLSSAARLLWDHFQQVTFIPFIVQVPTHCTICQSAPPISGSCCCDRTLSITSAVPKLLYRQLVIEDYVLTKH